MAVAAYIVWKVNNLTSYNEVGKFIDSPVITVGEINPTRWKLKLFPHGNKDSTKNYISIFLYLLEEKEITAIFSISIYSKDELIGQKNALKNGQNLFKSNGNWGFSEFASASKLDGQNSATVVVYIKIGNIKKILNNNLDKFSNQARHKIYGMQQKKELTDVEIKTKDMTIHCHQVVLATGSKVLKAMLMNHDTLESKINVISSPFGSHCMEKLVKFLYLDKLAIEKGKVDLGELITAADFYNVPKVKYFCESGLRLHLDTENVFEIIEIAWKVNSMVLVRHCSNLFKSQGKAIDDEKFKKFAEKNLDLMVYLVKLSDTPDELLEELPEMESDVPWNLFLKKELTDLTIRCCDEKIQCHEAILKANAPKFYDTLKNSSDGKEIKVDKFSHNCIMKLLEHIYTGGVGDYSPVMLEMIQAAEVYELSYLKLHCELILLEKLDTENAIEFLEAAWQSNCENLRDKAAELVIEAPDIMCSENYDSIVLKNFELARFVKKIMNARLREVEPPLKVILLYEHV